MASPFQQQSLRRKLVYTALILALFTGSVFFRKASGWGLESQAADLELRDLDRGEVELTGSALRLTLTGSRGLAVCLLWQGAIEKQKKNEWNELELLVKSLTKLQPHFITPWLFQSWNLAYNVSVESDRIRDKYFYIAEGIHLLAEGERQNKGNPDLRFSMGFYNQHKIGISDEANTLRSLYQMSAIDPVERDGNRLRPEDASGKRTIDLRRFELFCQRHPMLVRRLHDALKLSSPDDIVDFLADNYKIPSRYDEKRLEEVPGTEPRGILKRPEAQFPVSPPADPDERYERADPNSPEFDNFQVARDWYTYANKPLPPPSPEPGPNQPYDTRRYRMPRYMASVIFRGYPARGQSYVAEYLAKEGWIGRQGWEIKDWFADNKFTTGEEAVAGQERNWSLDGWGRAYEMWQKHGQDNSLYVTAEEQAAQERKAQKYRQRVGLTGNAPPRPVPVDQQTPEMLESFKAHVQIYWRELNRSMTNFPHFYYQAQVESEPQTAAVRRAFFLAEEHRKHADPAQALDTYREALPKWRDILLSHPGFRNDDLVAEESYEIALTYLNLLHLVYPQDFFTGLKKASVVCDFLGQAGLRPPLATVPIPSVVLVKGVDPSVATPLDTTDKEGQPLIPEVIRKRVRSRLGTPASTQPAQMSPLSPNAASPAGTSPGTEGK